MRKRREIDMKRLEELWNLKPRLTLAKIAEMMSTPTLQLSSQSVSSYAHKAGLAHRNGYTRKSPGTVVRRDRKEKGFVIKPLEQLLKRCPKCGASVENLAAHICPDARMVEQARRQYCS